MIPDILDRHDPRQFGLSGLFTRIAEPLTTRSEPGEQTAAIDEADVQIAEAHDVIAGLEFGNANELIHQRLADEDELAFPFDLAVAADATDLVIGVIPGILHAIRHGVLGALVSLRRRPLAKRFVRTFLVVRATKDVKAGRPLGRILCRWRRALRLQRAVHDR